MLVCHCKAVSEREIRAAVRGGARSCADVALACGASSACGGCAPAVEVILLEESEAVGVGEGEAIPLSSDRSVAA